MQTYIYVFPSKADGEVNLSMVWCLLAIGFAYKILTSLTGLYFEGDDGMISATTTRVCEVLRVFWGWRGG